MGIFFDGKPAAPGMQETPVAAVDVGECKSQSEQKQRK